MENLDWAPYEINFFFGLHTLRGNVRYSYGFHIDLNRDNDQPFA
jgi:hypothetical protein